MVLFCDTRQLDEWTRPSFELRSMFNVPLYPLLLCSIKIPQHRRVSLGSHLSTIICVSWSVEIWGRLHGTRKLESITFWEGTAHHDMGSHANRQIMHRSCTDECLMVRVCVCAGHTRSGGGRESREVPARHRQIVRSRPCPTRHFEKWNLDMS